MKVIKRVMLLFIFCFLFSDLSLSAVDFPRIEGWQILGRVEEYSPDNLWKYIDGAADLFLSFGFTGLQSAELQADSLIFVVDIYDMGRPVNAFGIWTVERPHNVPVLTIGARAVISPPWQSLMLKDRFYVKVRASQGKMSEENTEPLLRGLAAGLPGGNGLPEELALMPRQGKKAGSEKFIREGFKGLSGLKRCLAADYADEAGNGYQYFVVLSADSGDMQAVWQELASTWQQGKMKGREYRYRSIPYQGLIGVVRAGGRIFGVTDCADERVLKDRLGYLLDR